MPGTIDDYVTIHLSERKTTPFHEIGHLVENFSKNALRISKEFIKKRTKNNEYVRLADIFPGYGYKKYEITKPDNFISPYIGKEYDNASEVLSMGLESVFEPTEHVKQIKIEDGKRTYICSKIEDDKEYLYLIIGMILKV